MEVVPETKKLIQCYQNYNNSHLNMNHLVCAYCNCWLTTAIYLTEDSSNICESCKTEKNLIRVVQNKCLEELVKGTFYPCKNNSIGCNHMDTNIAAHEAECNSIISCADCNQTIGVKMAFMEHLANEHAMSITEMKKPLVEMSFNGNVTFPKYYHLQMGANSIVMKLDWDHVTQRMLLLLCNATDIDDDCDYLVIYKLDDTESRARGHVAKHLKWFGVKDNVPVAKIGNVNMQDNEGAVLKIYFANYEVAETTILSMEKLLLEFECPICSELLTDACYRCPNRHSICKECKPKVGTCPQCRFEIKNELVNCCDISGYAWNGCKNAPNGCFIYKQTDQLYRHEISCPWQSFICPFGCEQLFTRNLIIDHLVTVHEVPKIGSDWMPITPGYYVYNGKLFHYHQTYQGKQFEWYLQLMHETSTQLNEAEEYIYSLKIKLAGMESPVLQTTCVVQTSNNSNSIHLNNDENNAVECCIYLRLRGKST